MPKISVIIPVCNGERTIIETINSVLNQTYTDFEIIVVDDGSTDRTPELLKTVRDPRLKVFSYENAGVTIARNRGMDHIAGEYVSFLDADDLWIPNKLEAQLETLEKAPQAGVAYSWTAIIDQNGRFLYAHAPLYYEGDVLVPLLSDCFIASGSNILMRRICINSVGLFNPELTIAGDWEYYVRLAKEWNFVVVPSYQILYRHLPGQITSIPERVELYMSKAMAVVKDLCPEVMNHTEREALSNRFLHLAFLCVSRAPDRYYLRLAWRYILESIHVFPSRFFRKNMLYVICLWAILCLAPSGRFHGIMGLFMKAYGRLQWVFRKEVKRDLSWLKKG